ncbi:MAG: metal-dependent hydrolase [Nitrospinae bacterium]|nr:metal-dependent hydrolase [Nitrospinota bacterium]
MPTPIGHSLLGLSIMAAAYGVKKPAFTKHGLKLAVFCVAAACLPDIDFVHWDGNGLTLTGACHHGITHSIGFALFAASLAGLWAKLAKHDGWPKIGLLTFALVGSHVLADLFGVDGYAANGIGVPALWPFSGEYHIIPILPAADRANVFSMGSLWAMIVELFVFGGIFAVSTINAGRRRKSG